MNNEERNNFLRVALICLTVIVIGVAAIVWGIVALNKIDRTAPIDSSVATVTNGEVTTTTETTTDISETTTTEPVVTVTVPAYVDVAKKYLDFTAYYVDYLGKIVRKEGHDLRYMTEAEMTDEEEAILKLWRIKETEFSMLNDFVNKTGGAN